MKLEMCNTCCIEEKSHVLCRVSQTGCHQEAVLLILNSSSHFLPYFDISLAHLGYLDSLLFIISLLYYFA